MPQTKERSISMWLTALDVEALETIIASIGEEVSDKNMRLCAYQALQRGLVELTGDLVEQEVG